MHKVRVWDLPTRIFHWLLVVGVALQFLTGKLGGDWMVWHGRVGVAVLSLLLFRLLWGFVGGHWSRFAQFIPTPRRLLAYLRGQGRPQDEVGHSPLGALSVLAMLLALTTQAITGLFSDDEIMFAGPLAASVSYELSSDLTSWHKRYGQGLLLVLVALHLAAIAYYSVVRRRPLVRAMVHGDKELTEAHPGSADGPSQRWRALGCLLLGAALTLGTLALYQGA